MCMSENFKVSFQKAAKPWIHKGVSLIKMLLFKDPKTRENHHRPRSVVVIPYHPFLKMSLFFSMVECVSSHLHLAVTNHVGSFFNHAMVTFDLLATARTQ